MGRIQFCQTSQHESKTSPSTESKLSSVPLASDITPTQPSPPVTPHKPRVTLINAATYLHACKLKGSQCFQLRISLPEVTGCSTATSLVNLMSLPKEYHDFMDVFSKSKAGKLAEHQPYDLKITFDKGTVPPFSPIYSLSQEELAALRKFIDENLATGFICPSQPPCGAPVLFIRKKDGSLWLCVNFRGLNQISKKDHYLLPLISDLLDAPRKAQVYTKINLSLAHIPSSSHYSWRQMEDSCHELTISTTYSPQVWIHRMLHRWIWITPILRPLLSDRSDSLRSQTIPGAVVLDSPPVRLPL